ncbi:MAG: DUF4922 domain-containing protein [Muribaculaceae bacterium]|nr:DUF4922 domain-containing protein [Muribaculaceae bacterium]
MIDAAAFITAQRAEWPLAARNFDALEGVEVRSIAMPGMDIKVQFNPARIVSSGAKVDARSLAERPCFLCEKNRPAEQRGIDRRGYTVLVNPFPIFPRHLTIPAVGHTPQRIQGRVADMLALAAELPGYTVFYNGPRCGASAPDHMHFQAGNSDFLPIWQALDAAPLRTVADDGAGTRLSVCTALPVNVFVVDAATPEAGERMFDRLYRVLPEGEEEPMMNLLAAGSRLVVVPRKRHRPSFYGTEGEGCMLLSPASVDMGGAFITPRREDFDRLDAQLLARVFDELCLDTEQIEVISNKVS